jgi:hypothetical protein
MAAHLNCFPHRRTPYNDRHKVTPTFSASCPPLSYIAHITSSINTPLFLSRFNRMTADIGSLTAGLDGRVVWLGIGRKGLRKTCRNPHSFFFVSIVDSLAMHLYKPLCLCPLSPILLAPWASSSSSCLSLFMLLQAAPSPLGHIA